MPLFLSTPRTVCTRSGVYPFSLHREFRHCLVLSLFFLRLQRKLAPWHFLFFLDAFPGEFSGKSVLKHLASSRFTLSTILSRIEVKIIYISLSFNASFHFLLEIFDSIFCGFPMSLMNLSIFFIVASQIAFFNGYSFVCFVNVSTTTKICSYPYFVFTRGPKKSMDISSNGSFVRTDS